MKAYYDVCPCKGCNNRAVGCHAKCASYKKWQDNGIEVKEPYVEPKKKWSKKRYG